MDFNNMSVEEMAKAYMQIQIENMKKAEEEKAAAEKEAAEAAEKKRLEDQIFKIFNR